MEDTKRNYQKELLELCGQWWASYEDTIAKQPRVRFDWPGFLHEFVKTVALDSFKNGVQAGIKRANTRPPQTHAKQAPRTLGKGTALSNGKLKPVEQEPTAEEA